MISQTYAEDTDLRKILVPAEDQEHFVVFTRPIKVETFRREADVTDGSVWFGGWQLPEGATFAIRENFRGPKRKPCRLNTLTLLTTEFNLQLLDVPEDSYEVV